jgi:hypothetical protein
MHTLADDAPDEIKDDWERDEVATEAAKRGEPGLGPDRGQ